jgi:hypothetical protein
MSKDGRLLGNTSSQSESETSYGSVSHLLKDTIQLAEENVIPVMHFLHHHRGRASNRNLYALQEV